MPVKRSERLNNLVVLSNDRDSSDQDMTLGDNKSGLLFACGRLLDKAIFFCLLVTIVTTILLYGTVDAWWEAAFECVIFLLTAAWVFEGLFGGDWHLRNLTVILPLVALTFYAFLQAAPWPSGSAVPHSLSIDHYQTYLTARKSLALTLCLAMLISHITSTKRYRWTVRTVIGVGLASALFAILRQFLQAADSPSGFVLPFLFYGVGYGQFISPNLFAYLMELTLGLSAGLVLGGGVRKDRLLVYAAVVVVMWTALVLSNSRGGIMGLACESLFVLYFALKWYSEAQLAWGNEPNRIARFIGTSKPARVVGIVLILVALIGAVVWMGGDNLATKFVGNSDSVDATLDGSTRQEIWRASWKLFKHHPWIGTGFGAYYLGVPEFQLTSGKLKLEQAHSDYLDLAASGGIIALVLGGWFVFAIIRGARTSFQRRDPYLRAGSLGAATGLLGVAVHSIADFGLQVTGIAVVCAALVGLLFAGMSVARNSANGQHPSPRRLRLTTH